LLERRGNNTTQDRTRAYQNSWVHSGSLYKKWSSALANKYS